MAIVTTLRVARATACALAFVTLLPTGAIAQQSKAGAAVDKGTRLITVGTAGGPTPRAHRAQSSNLLVVNGTPYLIDAGDGTVRRLAKMGFTFRSLTNIFITHGHDDHTAGLAPMLITQWNLARKTPIHVYGPPGTKALVDGAIAFLHGSSEIRLSDGSRSVPIEQVFTGHDVGTGQMFADANVKVTAVENSHYNFKPGSPGYGKYKSYSYRFETADKVVVFSGDTGPSEALATLAKGADLFVVEVGSVDDVVEVRRRNGTWEAMTAVEQKEFIRHQIDEHLMAEEVGKLAAKAGVKTVILTHLVPRPGSNDYSPWAVKVKAHFSGPVLVAEDLKEF